MLRSSVHCFADISRPISVIPNDNDTVERHIHVGRYEDMKDHPTQTVMFYHLQTSLVVDNGIMNVYNYHNGPKEKRANDVGVHHVFQIRHGKKSSDQLPLGTLSHVRRNNYCVGFNIESRVASQLRNNFGKQFASLFLCQLRYKTVSVQK